MAKDIRVCKRARSNSTGGDLGDGEVCGEEVGGGGRLGGGGGRQVGGGGAGSLGGGGQAGWGGGGALGE